MNIVSGEKLQKIADIYLGYPEDFRWNPYIARQINKQKNILDITAAYNNPRFVFCYSHRITFLATIIHFFTNEFILITHNSDENIAYDSSDKKSAIEKIINCELLSKWYSQNLCIENSKIHFLPIGIANQQWAHGSMFNLFYQQYVNKQINKLNKSVYFFFEISTNKVKRQICYDSLVNKIHFLNVICPMDNYIRFSQYEFCICPEGNGIDTHRFWEALYLKCVPIVVKNPLIDIIRKNTNLPMIILDSWNDFDYTNLPDYETFDFTSSNKYLDLNFYSNAIRG